MHDHDTKARLNIPAALAGAGTFVLAVAAWFWTGDPGCLLAIALLLLWSLI